MRQSLYNTIKHPLWWALAILLIAIRIPSLHRPLSKHHEQNSAVLLINSISWQQAGGAAAFRFTPLLNFQGKANKLLEKGPHIDSLGNHVYLSYGAGWYIIPYFIFEAFGIPHTPVALRWLSICFGLLSALLLAAWLAQMLGNTRKAILSSALFCLLPAPLWYMGIAYANTAVMLPFVILMLWCWQQMADHPQNINTKHLVALAMSAFVAIQIEWYAMFVLGAMGGYSLWAMKTQKRYLLMFAAAAIVASISVIAILAQFASYLGWQQVADYWFHRFSDRSVKRPESGTAAFFTNSAINLITGYAPLVLMALMIMLQCKKLKWGNGHWKLWLLVATIIYNLLFLNWSAEHEFAWLAASLVAFVILVTSLNTAPWSGRVKYLAAFMCAWSIAQYFYFNRPGPLSFKGDEYAAQQRLGKSISTSTKPNQVIFTNLPFDKITEYYSGRTYNHANGLIQASAMADSLHLHAAIWIEVQNNQIRNAAIIAPR